MKLSVVIPVHDEERALRRCLDSLAAQLSDIHEVVVVDNNSTDGSLSIAREFERRFPAFRVVEEREQGLVHARNKGFAAATGDVYARIDADTLVSDDWATSIAHFYDRHSSRYAAGVGLCSFYDMPNQERLRAEISRIERSWRTDIAAGKDVSVSRLLGCNMSILASAWGVIEGRTHRRNDIFEDMDIALSLSEIGVRAAIIPGASAQISARRFRSSPISYWKYLACERRVHRLHGRKIFAMVAIVPHLFLSMPVYLRLRLAASRHDARMRRRHGAESRPLTVRAHQ